MHGKCEVVVNEYPEAQFSLHEVSGGSGGDRTHGQEIKSLLLYH